MDSSSQRRGYRHGFAKLALLISVTALWGAPCISRAADLLVVDRLSNSVYRYSASGALLGTVIDNSTDLNQPTGIGMSPDFKALFVASSQNNRVIKYDYDVATGAATNPTIFADAAGGLAFPNDVLFSPDGSKVYVANLDGGVSRFNANGTSAGSKLVLSPPAGAGDFAASSMAFTSGGKLLAGSFQEGGVVISDSSVSGFPQYLVQPTPAITGATGLMIHDGYLYASGLFTTSIRRFELSSGQIDASWAISGVGFPQDLVEAPDGNGFLAGILGFAAGGGNISRYSFNGTFLNTFASPAAPGQDGFTEATAFVVVPTQLMLVGDFNGNGVVDAADYVVWRNASPTATLPNDDTPGVVDASDYQSWRANFGKSTPASASALGVASVPEPAGFLLLCIAILAGSTVRNRA